MRLDTAIRHLKNVYNFVKDETWVQKPVSYALYQTWKWADEWEKPREKEQENESGLRYCPENYPNGEVRDDSKNTNI